jgi:hypothetical protein
MGTGKTRRHDSTMSTNNHTCLYIGHDWFVIPILYTTRCEGVERKHGQIIEHCTRCQQTNNWNYDIVCVKEEAK